MVCHMFQCWQSSSLRITRCRWAMSGGIQCFMLNVTGLKVDAESTVFKC